MSSIGIQEQAPNRHFGDDPYSTGGLDEKRFVFVDGQDVPARLRTQKHLRVGELGFGLGLSALALMQAAQEAGATVELVSFELYPQPWAVLTALWRRVGGEVGAALAQAVESLADGEGGCIAAGPLLLDLRVGDARQLVPTLPAEATFDAWFLDGHAPTKNPELWKASLLQEVGLRTKAGGTVATYSCARVVKDALAGAGFELRREVGFGQKRHRLVGYKKR